MSKNAQQLSLDHLRLDGGTQARATLNEDRVAEYAESMQAGDEFPPIVVFHDGKDYWMGGGSHRYFARKKAGFTDIAAEVRQGTQRDARLYAIGDNADHGLPRTREDKRRAVWLLLEDEEWSQCSVKWLHEKARVSEALVNLVKGEWEAKRVKSGLPIPTERIGRDGKKHANVPKHQESVKDTSDDASGLKCAATQPEGATEAPPVLDGLKKPVPSELAEVFKGAEEYAKLITGLNDFKRRVEALKEGPEGVFLAPVCQAGIADLENAKQVLKCGKPYTLCPDCKGNGCMGAKPVCKGSGFITEDIYKRLDAPKKSWCQNRAA